MRPPRKIIGVQIYHSVNLNDASRFGVNMLTALDSAISKMEDPPPHLCALRDQLGAGVKDIGVYLAEAQNMLNTLWNTDSETFIRARDGYIPWPGENDNVELKPDNE
jgi:hypothetical protein